MGPDWSFDISIGPEAALARLGASINRPRRRAFGVFKQENEFVGVVGPDEFEIWERGQRAVHGVGLVRSHPGGSRVDVCFRIPPRTRFLIAAFFVLYAVVVIGLAQLPPDPPVSAQELLASVLGAGIVGMIFWVSARRQQADLQAVIEQLFSDLPSPSAEASKLLAVQEARETQSEVREDVEDDHREDL